MFCSIQEIDLKKKPGSLEEVRSQMSVEAGILVISEENHKEIPELRFTKKGRVLSYSVLGDGAEG